MWGKLIIVRVKMADVRNVKVQAVSLMWARILLLCHHASQRGDELAFWSKGSCIGVTGCDWLI